MRHTHAQMQSLVYYYASATMNKQKSNIAMCDVNMIIPLKISGNPLHKHADKPGQLYPISWSNECGTMIDKFIAFKYVITTIISPISNFKNTLYSCCDCKWLILLQAPYRNLEDRILQVNPIMEAFGNARTGINANSSRFGKYLDLTMTRAGKVTGARVSVYLLEQSRVSQQAQ